jgi:deoxyribose-phosphate aldolase
MTLTREELASKIDHTLLKVDSSKKELEKLCKDAVKYGFHSVCVTPYFLQRASNLVEGSNVKLCTVIGFPFGYEPTSSKVEAIRFCALQGAQELDVVINVQAVLNKDWSYVNNDISSVVNASHMHGAIVKLIIETAYLNPTQIKEVCKICADAGADFVKTSTGFGPEGANEEDVALMKSVLPKEVKIKASGGIRSKTKCASLIRAGADRIGCSSGVEIINSIID